jgi:hypothetical protein
MFNWKQEVVWKREQVAEASINSTRKGGYTLVLQDQDSVFDIWLLDNATDGRCAQLHSIEGNTERKNGQQKSK